MRKAGYEIINPQMVMDCMPVLSEDEAGLLRQYLLSMSYGLMVMEGWHKNDVAKMELQTALTKGMRIYTEAEMRDQLFPVEVPAPEPAPPEPAPELEEDPEEPPAKKPKSVPGARIDLDMGKVMALKNAGWNIAKIADEMGVSKSKIYNELKSLEGTA